MTKKTVVVFLILFTVLYLTACSEEEYCEGRYITHYDNIELYDGSTYLQPVYACP